MSHIFISYSHQDSEYAHLLATTLQQAGFTVWIDDRIDYGTQWPHVIQENLDSCVAFIVIMTPRAYQSEWVQNELSRAKRKKKHVFPLLLEGDEPWLSVEAIQYIDVTNGRLPPRSFYRVLARVALHITVQEEWNEQNKEFKPLVQTPTKPPFTLPMLEWVPIPAGQVTIAGTDYPVAAFQMTKYLVTNTQYQAFVDAPDGYRDAQWWDYSEYARKWREENPKSREGRFKGDKRPRENVTWYEAIAFCRWLSHKTGLSITLPTEQQWQRAAQGNDNRKYPWGNTFDKNKCNTGESGIDETTDVDRYEKDGKGFSPYGVCDLTGNVREWCLSEYNIIDVNISSDNMRRVCGGSWKDNWSNSAAAFPHWELLAIRDYDLGLRLVLSEF